MMERISGQCLCGAVTITAEPAKPVLRACHCDMCRRWTSSMFMSVPTVAGSVTTQGPVKMFKSSDWAERAFCETCGSALWYGMPALDQINLAAGLFDNAAGHTLRLEFFSDKRPAGYALAGDHKRMTEAECIAMFAPLEGTKS